MTQANADLSYAAVRLCALFGQRSEAAFEGGVILANAIRSINALKSVYVTEK